MERTPRDARNLSIGVAIASQLAASKPAQALDPAMMPPASAPFEFGWRKFQGMAVAPQLGVFVKRLVEHAFYAGGRLARQTMTDGLSEMASDDPELVARGEERLASLEIEIEKHFTEAMRAASNMGKIQAP
jgi:hypothetical protein